jgi:hypothetical protein
MKKIFFLMVALGLTLSACGTSAKPQTQAVAQPSPISEADLRATAAALSQQTLQALPTQTVKPSSTPVAVTPTNTATPSLTPTQATPTETQNPILLTLTATLGTGTPATPVPGTIIPTDPIPGMATSTPDYSAVTTDLPMPIEYGTMPPDLPGGKVILVNKSNSETYISLQGTTKEGYHSVVEYAVEGKARVIAPAGNYYFVAWVGGKKFTGNFKLGVGGDATITMYKDRVETK